MPDRSEVDALAAAPKHRLVLLGASNLTRGLSCVLGTARARLALDDDQILDAMIAAGHGRSYVIESTVGIRTLPAIQSCTLWTHLQERLPVPTFALLTDVGNDIMYGVEPGTILDHVRSSLRRLGALKARIVLAGLPMESIRRISPTRYRVVKRVLFPTCGLSYTDAISRAEQVEEGLRETARAHHAAYIEPDPAWYGVDPIHVKWKHWPEAWRVILSAWNDASSPPLAEPSFHRWLKLKACLPRHWKVVGRELAHRQPLRPPIDSTLVSMY